MEEEARPSYDPESSGRRLFVVAFVAGALLRLVLLGRPDLFGFDEGSWAVGARNLVEGGLSQVLGLSRTPLGEPSGTPILFPAIGSVMVSVFGPEEWAIRLPAAFAGLVLVFVLERLVRRSYGQPAGHLAGAFAALFPPLVSASRTASADTTLVALGLGGIIFGVRALEEDEPLEGALAGALLGLGFLTKGHAVLLFLAPLLAAIAARPGLFSLGETKRTLGYLLGSMVLVGGAHFLVVAALSPGHLPFLVASAFGATEEVVRSLYEPTAFAADPKALVRTLFVFLPLAGVGAAYLARDVGEREIESGATEGERRLAHGWLWSVYGLELLAFVAVSGHLRLSAVAVMPALAAFTGLGASALVAPARESRWRRLEVTVAVASGILVVGTALALMATPDDPLFGGLRAPLPSGTVLLAIGVTAIGAAVLASGFAKRLATDRLSPVFVGALLVVGGLTCGRAVRHDLLTHRTGSREAADQIAPAVASLAPRARAFRAPEPEAIAFRLFRTGRSWRGVTGPEALVAEAQAAEVRCWAYRENEPVGTFSPPVPVQAWLSANAREVTAEVNARAGRHTGLRVFVPAPAGERGAGSPGSGSVSDGRSAAQ